MKVITTAKEFMSGISFIKEVVKQLPKQHRDKMLTDIKDLKSGLVTYCDMSEQEAAAFRERFMPKSDRFVGITLDANLNVVIELTEDKVVEISNVLEEEIEGFSGMFITCLGLLKVFNSRLEKIGKKIKAVAIR